MKKLLLFIVFLLFVNYGYCQDWYQDGTTIPAGGIVYKVKRSAYTLHLSNVDNVLTQQPKWRYKDGTTLSSEEEYYAVDFDMISKDGLFRAFAETFSEEELAPLRLLKESPLSLYFAVGPNGNVLEVSFIMDAEPALLEIPPFKYGMLERKLKSHVKFKVNHYGQKLQFMQGEISINFATMQLIRDIPPGGFDVEYGE